MFPNSTRSQVSTFSCPVSIPAVTILRVNNWSDQKLLAEYAGRRSETAFAELVRRHVDLVYSAALRMVRDRHVAEDVTQAVFVALARSAPQLVNRPVLSGWLHRTAQNLAANAVRSDVRRRAREQEAAAMNELLSNESDAPWQNIAPHLDDALGELSEADRDALLLRYFERKSASEMADLLGISEDAAQKRVSRAVERLRGFFAKRGITVGATGLVAVVTANAVQAAPVGLAATISTSAMLAGTAVATTAATAKLIAMTTLQRTLIAAVIVTGTGTTLYEAHRASEARKQADAVRQQFSPLSAEIESLRRARDDATNSLAALLAENGRLRGSKSELLRLRGEVTELRSELIASSTPPPTPSEAASWLSRLNELKKRLDERPDQEIPELEFLSEKDWLNVARDVVVTNDVSLRRAFERLRSQAKTEFAPMMSRAIREYARAHNNQLPTDILDFGSYFVTPVSKAILQRYQLVQSGDLDSKQPVVAEKDPVDNQMDCLFKIGAESYWYSSVTPGGESGMATSNASSNDHPLWVDQIMYSKSPPMPPEPDVSQEMNALSGPLQAYRAAHNNNDPDGPADIVPYIQTDAQQSAYDKLMQLAKDDEMEDQAHHEATQEYDRERQIFSEALSAFMNDYPGRWPQTPSDLMPYLKTPDDKAALEKLLAQVGAKL